MKSITAATTQELEKGKVKQQRTLLAGLENRDKEEAVKAIEKAGF